MPYSFPEDGLLRRLVDIYFNEENTIHPLVYRPTFEVRLSSSLHEHDRSFGALVLAMVSIASWHCDDPRVLHDSMSAGWQWYRQIRCTPNASTSPPNLHTLQTYVLCSFYATATNVQTEYAWNLPGFGLRMAQVVGAHRQKHGCLPSAEDEEWKRAFWALYGMDAFVSASTGRPMAMGVDDFDVYPPLAVDEAYWGTPEAFVQPEDAPSSNACWTHFCALLEIVGFANQTIYAPRRSNLSLEMSLPDWDKRTVVAIDNALDEWVDDIPEHLRWNLHNPNAVFFKQSVSLYTSFYFATILVHRPFITSCADPISINWPSLALCVNAARSMCHVVDAYSRRGFAPMFYLQTMVFWAATVLSMNVWRNKALGNDAQVRQDVGNVRICTHYLRMAEKWCVFVQLYPVSLKLTVSCRWPNVRRLVYVSSIALPKP
ncbi:hypothetical protein CYLTODRAFT_358655 [Cylindrobasidium torrendii FP15055 ss-10]|uniref:Xylanolytic transcriptional activator regulatory domain-containing protein n=1 Tax=Cylindrobasidium torrendii FP15055 ss-10 TaxID=1314674 RepID=A0A0D7B427_9AGAR|nr:hypothetical protein CYLTODRAFT_358655 [Cylindrobasidium torrendii FP15055 ss-10]